MCNIVTHHVSKRLRMFHSPVYWWVYTTISRPKVSKTEVKGHISTCARHYSWVLNDYLMGMVQNLSGLSVGWPQLPAVEQLTAVENKRFHVFFPVPKVRKEIANFSRGQGRTGPQFHGALLCWKFLCGCRCGLCRLVAEDTALGGGRNKVVRNSCITWNTGSY